MLWSIECAGIGSTHTLEKQDKTGILRSRNPQLIYFLPAYFNCIWKKICNFKKATYYWGFSSFLIHQNVFCCFCRESQRGLKGWGKNDLGWKIKGTGIIQPEEKSKGQTIAGFQVYEELVQKGWWPAVLYMH